MTDDDNQGRVPPLLRSFGRRRGRKLGPQQQSLLREVLPRLAITTASPAPRQASDLFQVPVEQVWLEIGFGGAEHLLWQAVANPAVGIIGSEPFQESVVKALAGIETAHLRNVRLYPDDVRTLLDWLPRGSIDRVFVLFPDPWPKKRHAKRRLVSPTLLRQLQRVMRPGGELRLATDIQVYARDMMLAVRRAGGFVWNASGPAEWKTRPADWPQTRYEAKAVREGRCSVYLSLACDPAVAARGRTSAINNSS